MTEHPLPMSENQRANQPLLSVRRLRTSFVLDEGIVKAVDDVSFDVHPGQVLGIVGESGCGKSATVKSILRIIEPPGRIVGGEIRFRRPNGAEGGTFTDLAQLDARGKEMRAIRGGEIALIPQEPMAAFSPVHTIGNQLIEAVRLHGRASKAQARNTVIARLHEVGVPSPEQCMDRYSWELSGGLRQRAIIGMALSCNPSLLIADEPTTAIDVTTQAQVLQLLRNLQREHETAFIFITHDLGVIAQIADFVVVMYLGKVMEAGPIDRIFHNPHHPYTRALLASISTLHTENRSRLPTIEGSIPHPFNRPAGCPFWERCTEVMRGTCDRSEPRLQAIGDRHSVSCFKYEDRADEC
ncbi:MAG: ABC transporter ATP-binding protein [Gammaproteobacteria bacterium]